MLQAIFYIAQALSIFYIAQALWFLIACGTIAIDVKRRGYIYA
jgi:hypothetical protein